MPEGKWVYLEFIEQSKSGKTEVHMVHSKQGNLMLGMIKWEGPWRGYAFFPFDNTLYEQRCLRDIAGFIETLNREHAKARKEAAP